MPPYQWSLIGLVLDIVGVLLLSVEAIKLDNIRKLRARFLSPLHDAVRPQQIRFVGPNEPDYSSPLGGTHSFVWWLFTHGGSGALTMYLAVARFRHFLPAATATIIGWWAGLKLGWKIGSITVGVLFGLNLAISIGEWWHKSIIWLTGRFVAAADFIDRRTPDGTIGLIGVALALVGFGFQLVGTWLSRPK